MPLCFFFTEFSKKDITYVFLLFFLFLKNTHLFGSDIFCHLYHRIFGGNYKVHSIKRMKKKCENQKLTYFLWIQTFVVFKYSKSENKHYFQETRKTFFVTQCNPTQNIFHLLLNCPSLLISHLSFLMFGFSQWVVTQLQGTS